MVNSISGVSFKGAPTVANPVMHHDDPLSREAISRQGMFTDQQLVDMGLIDPKAAKKKSGFFGKLVKFVVAVAVVAAGAVALRKLVPKLNYELSELPEKAKFAEKAKYYFAKSTDWLYDNTYKKIVEYIEKKKISKQAPASHNPAPASNGSEA